jgi:AcrR family transcriptional regulator
MTTAEADTAPAARAGGLRERKKAETRSALRAAATTLARREGPDSPTVEEICAEVGVSPRTFFNYFASKDDALFGVDADTLVAITDGVVCRPAAQTPARALTGVLGDLLDDAAGSAVWHDQLALLRDHPEVLPRLAVELRAFEAACVAGVARRLGLAESDPYPRTVAAVVLAAQRVAVTTWREHPDDEPPRAVLERTVALVVDGLPVPPSVS